MRRLLLLRSPQWRNWPLSEYSATFFTVVGNSDYYWRVVAPAKAIGAKSVQIPEDTGLMTVLEPNTDSVFPWAVEPDIWYGALEGSAAVWTRPDPTRAIHAQAMEHQYGVRTVAEVDDNYLSDTKFNIYMKSNGFNPKHRLSHLKSVSSMKAAVFTTEWLRDEYWKAIRKEFGGGKGYRVPEMFVAGNHLFLEDWPEPIERDGPLRVGWMGSPSHIWDVDNIWAALMFAKQEGCETVMVGYDPSEPEHAVETEKSLFKTQQWKKVGARIVPWKKLDGTTRMSLPLDIGLCPLLYNGFTLGKSDIKAVEYTISGAAVIAQSHPVYTRSWKHEETCLLAGSPHEFIEATRRLIRDSKLRRELIQNAQEYVRNERDITKHAGEWRAAVLGD